MSWTTVATPQGLETMGSCLTQLSDKTVVIAGGLDRAYGKTMNGNVELFEPATMSWRRAGELKTPRAWATASRLSDERVLFAGGEAGVAVLSSVEIFDPTRGETKATGAMNTARAWHSATVLLDGRVLVVGGRSVSSLQPNSALHSCELYDPVKGTWTVAAKLAEGRMDHAAALLADGRVLIVGGVGQKAESVRVFEELRPEAFLRSVELYDPATDQWTTLDPVPVHIETPGIQVSGSQILLHAISRHPDDSVYGIVGHLEATEGAWTHEVAPAGMEPQVGGLLADGRILVGGYNWVTRKVLVSTLDPETGAWSNFPPPPHAGMRYLGRLEGNSLVLVTNIDIFVFQ